MELFTRLILLEYSSKTLIFKISYINDINKIDLYLQTYLITNSNNSTIKILKDKIYENPFDDSILKRVNNTLHSEKFLNYNSTKENYLILKKQLSNEIYNVKNNDKSQNDVVIWSICNDTFKFPLKITDMLIIIKDIQTYLDQYGLISSINKLISSKEINKEKNIDNIENNNEDKKEFSDNKEIEIKSNNEFDNIHDFIIDNSIKYFLVNNILNYYKYIKKKI
jgi:hypothetical protein